MEEKKSIKAGSLLREPEGSALKRYRALQYGNAGPVAVGRAMLVMTAVGDLPGAVGLFLRKILYPGLFQAAGPGIIFGRRIVIRHPHKIRLGTRILIDDHTVLDAKGDTNTGITLGDGVFIGRNTILNCKDGDIRLGNGVNVSSNCTLVSSNSLTVHDNTVIGGYGYLVSGGTYDIADGETPFAQQIGAHTKGPLTIGANCWLGARVTVLDAADIGPHCVIGAGAVVTQPIPADSMAVGVPARVVRQIP